MATRKKAASKTKKAPAKKKTEEQLIKDGQHFTGIYEGLPVAGNFERDDANDLFYFLDRRSGDTIDVEDAKLSTAQDAIENFRIVTPKQFKAFKPKPDLVVGCQDFYVSSSGLNSGGYNFSKEEALEAVNALLALPKLSAGAEDAYNEFIEREGNPSGNKGLIKQLTAVQKKLQAIK